MKQKQYLGGVMLLGLAAISQIDIKLEKIRKPLIHNTSNLYCEQTTKERKYINCVPTKFRVSRPDPFIIYPLMPVTIYASLFIMSLVEQLMV